MGVYTGSSVSSLTTVASDDDSGGNYTSKVTFNAVAGTTYQIAVDGYNRVRPRRATSRCMSASLRSLRRC